MCKILEKIINKCLVWFLDKYNIIPKEQSGFRRHRSTLDNLVLLQNDIANSINNKYEVIAAIFDIQGAFDRISRQAIISKLNQYHINGNIFYFIQNFLTQRSFRVSVNGHFSSLYTQTDGAPQGSVLSPALFNLAISDLCHNLPSPTKYVAYADELILYCDGRSASTSSKILQTAVNLLLARTRSIGLTLSSTKSKIIKFGRRPQSPISHIFINDSPSQWLITAKY